jgi:hypothetical protein
MLLAMDAEPELLEPLLGTAWATFVPRPNRPEEVDQQTSYIEACDLVSFALGGNASGKTAASARKCADFVLTTPPPRRKGDTYFSRPGSSVSGSEHRGAQKNPRRVWRGRRCLTIWNRTELLTPPPAYRDGEGAEQRPDDEGGGFGDDRRWSDHHQAK